MEDGIPHAQSWTESDGEAELERPGRSLPVDPAPLGRTDRVAGRCTRTLKSRGDFSELLRVSGIPSIKGLVFRASIECLQRHVREGNVLPEDLDESLSRDDRILLDQPIVDCAWYPIECYVRINELLLDVVGKGDPAFLEGLGRANAHHLIDCRIYMQLQYLAKAEVTTADGPDARSAAFGRDLVVISSLQSSILNFSRVVLQRDPVHPLRWVCEVSDATHYPTVYAHRARGFKNEMARRRQEQSDLWLWERPEADRVIWRMVRDP